MYFQRACSVFLVICLFALTSCRHSRLKHEFKKVAESETLPAYPNWVEWSVPLTYKSKGVFPKPFVRSGRLVYTRDSMMDRDARILSYDLETKKGVWAADPNEGLAPYLGPSKHRGPWRSRYPLRLWEAGPIALLEFGEMENLNSSGQGKGNGLMAVDSQTGEILWMKPNANLYGISVLGDRYATLDPAVLRVFEASNGRLLWSVPLNQPTCCKISDHIATNKEGVFVIDAGRLRARTWGGRELWQTVEGPLTFSKLWAGDGAIYAMSADQQLQAVSVIDGRPLWKWKLPGKLQSLLVGPESVFLLLEDLRIFRLHKDTANILWESKCDVMPEVPMAVQGHVLLIPGKYRALTALDVRTGKFLWRYPVRTSAPLEITDSSVVVVDGLNGRIIALRVPDDLANKRSLVRSAAKEQSDPRLAEEILLNLLEADPSCGEAYLDLANLSVKKFLSMAAKSRLEQFPDYIPKHSPLYDQLVRLVRKQSVVRWTARYGTERIEGLAFDSRRTYILTHRRLVALKKKSGKEAWTLALGDNGTPMEVPRRRLVLDKGMLYLSTGKGTLMCVESKSGNLLWKKALDPANSYTLHDPTVIAGRVYVTQTYYKRTALRHGKTVYAFYALDANTGRILWRVPIHIDTEGYRVNENRLKPAVDQRQAYFPTLRGGLYAVDIESGNLAWTFFLPSSTGTAITGVGKPVVVRNNVLLPGYDGFVYSLDAATGGVVWKKDVRRPGYSVVTVPDMHIFGASKERLFLYFHGFLWRLDVENGQRIWKKGLSAIDPLGGFLEGSLWTKKDAHAVVASDPKTGVSSGEMNFPWIKYIQRIETDGQFLYVVDKGRVTQIIPSLEKVAISILIEAMKGDNGNKKWEAKELLLKMEPIPEAAVPIIIQDVLRGYGSGSSTIKKIGSRGGKTTSLLMEAIKNDGYRVQYRAALLLRDLGEEGMVALIKILKDPNPTVVSMAAESLGEIGPKAAQAIPALIEVLRSPETQDRYKVAEALVKIGKSAIPALIETLKNENASYAAAHALGKIGPPAKRAVPDLIHSLEKGNGRAAYALGMIGPEASSAVPSLIAAAQDRRVREAAILALGWIGPKSSPVVPHLITLLESKEKDCTHPILGSFTFSSCSYFAATALGDIGPGAKAAVPALVKILRKESPPIMLYSRSESIDYSWKAVEALRKIGTEKAIEAVKRYKVEVPERSNPLYIRRSVKGPTNLLNTRISVHITSGSLKSFLAQISAQSKVIFTVVEEGLEDCTVTAYLQGVTAREALQILLEVRGLTYQRGGRSNHYLVSARHGALACPKAHAARPAAGFCRAIKAAPIALACEDGPLYKFAEIVADQAGTNFLIRSGLEDSPITARLAGADIQKAMAILLKSDTLTFKRFGGSEIYLISPRKLEAPK